MPGVADVRNIALVGHHGSGKTTLADLMLFKAGAVSSKGSPDAGNSHLDADEEEKERKSSVSSSIGHFDHNGKQVHLIDTPGYPDFIGQAIGSLRAAETAIVVVNASGGVEVNTRRVFEKAGDAGIGRMIVINRMDMDNLDFDGVVSAVQESFGAACVPINLPVGIGADFTGVVSTLELPADAPAGVVGDPEEVNAALMDAIVEADEELMERYLEGDVSPEEAAGGLTKAIAAGTLIPIFFTSATKDIGVDELLNGIAQFAPSPADIGREFSKGGEETAITPDAEGAFLGQVFKTRIDAFVGKISYIRVFAGSFKKGGSANLIRTGKSLKFNQIQSPQGNENTEIDAAGPGDIFAVLKVEELKTGDTLSSDGDVEMSRIPFPIPMIGLAVEPESRADQTKISGALGKVQDEDPTFNIVRDAQTHEMVMQGMSELHLELVKNRMEKRDKVKVVTHQPKIPYRETIVGQSEDSYRHKKQSGGSGQFGEVHFRLFSCPQDINPDEYFTKERFNSMREFHYDADLNSCFVDSITGGSIPNNFIPAVEKGIRERMTQGVIAGYQVQDVVCELFFGKDHPVDSNETAFKTAASMGFRKCFEQAKPVILEPIVNVEITVPDDKLGDITGDLNNRRGRVEGMDGLPGGFQLIRAKAALAEMMTYQRTLSSMTAGEGSFTMEFSHYEQVPANEQQKIVAAAKKEDEEA